MELKELVQEALNEKGYQGLLNSAVGCACRRADLMPCSEPGIRCEAAYVFECERCSKQESCALALFEGEVQDFVCATGKHFCAPDYIVCQKTDKTADENTASECLKSDALPAQTCPAALGA